MIGLSHYLTLSAILFLLAVVGIFINRRNVILLLMCIELMLLAVNFNFVAFSRYLNNLDGQIFVFFILTVAAAEAAIAQHVGNVPQATVNTTMRERERGRDQPQPRPDPCFRARWV